MLFRSVRKHTAREVTYDMRHTTDSRVKHPNVVCFTSVRTKKYSWDVKVDGKTYGLFTNILVRLLREARTQKTQLSCLDMLALLDRHLQSEDRGKNKQDPQLSVVNRGACEQNILI